MLFLIYDFKKGRLVDVPKIKRESQIEYRKKKAFLIFYETHKKKKFKEI